MPDDVLVGDRLSWGNPQWLRSVSSLRASWEISRNGLLSFDIPLNDMPSNYLDPSLLKRKWCRWQHPTAGTWGGVISSVSVNDGIVSIDAESWGAMLRGLVTWGITKEDIFSGTAQAINANQPYTGISFGGFLQPTSGELDRYPVSNPIPGKEFFTNGQDLYDSFLPSVMTKLYEDSGWRSSLRGLGWYIDPDTRVMTVDFTLGRDLLQSVHLVDRIHSVNSGWSDDIEEVYNWVILSGKFNVPTTVTTYAAQCTKWKKDKPQTDNYCINWINVPTTTGSSVTVQGTAVATVPSSINKFGPRQLMINRDQTFPDQATMQVFTQLIANRFSRDEQLVTIEIVDEYDVFADFREGDVVFASMSNNSWHGRMVVRTRAYDATTGVMTVSGEAERIW